MRTRLPLLCLAASAACAGVGENGGITPPPPTVPMPDTLWVNDAIAPRTSPAMFLATHVLDRNNNAVPYRLIGDGRLAVQDTALGSAGARTVTFGASHADSVWRTTAVTGEQDAPIAQFTYRVVIAQNAPTIHAVFCGLKVNPCESETWVP